MAGKVFKALQLAIDTTNSTKIIGFLSPKLIDQLNLHALMRAKVTNEDRVHG